MLGPHDEINFELGPEYISYMEERFKLGILHLSHFILHLANGIDMVSLVYLHIHVVLAKQMRAV